MSINYFILSQIIKIITELFLFWFDRFLCKKSLKILLLILNPLTWIFNAQNLPIFQSVHVCSFCVFKCCSFRGSAWLWQSTRWLNLPVDYVGLSRNRNVGMHWHRCSPSLRLVPEKTQMFVWCQINLGIISSPLYLLTFLIKA